MPNPICPAGTTYVPGGKDKRFRRAEVEGFCIDTKRVSNKSYNDAKEYCQSRGMRLPTAREWAWAFEKSSHLLSMGMKSKSGKTPHEFVESRRPSQGAWIRVYKPRVDPGFVNVEHSSVFLKEEARFRCAVEPKTYWAKQITGLVDGLLLFFVKAIRGWENPR